jgi:hypothetical protein
MVNKGSPSSASGGAGSPPRSAFSGGKYSSPIGKAKRDYRYELFVRGVQEGIVVLYFKKPGREEEPYLNHDYTHLNENPDVRVELGINAVLYRKGVDGVTPLTQTPTSHYAWRQLVCVVGTNEENTTQQRRALADRIIAHFNTNATAANYTYPKSVKFGQDVTGELLGPVDTVLLDEDVVAMMQSAYPTVSIQSFATFDEIMENFWTDPVRGASVLSTFVAE